MLAVSDELQAHLDGGATTMCRCWAMVSKDGVARGFTDHDLDLAFDGFVFRANTGLSGAALAQTTGLSVDNTQAIGGLSDFGLTEADIMAGRYDGASISAWLVNWRDVEQRLLQFKGSIGEIRRGDGAFEAELRGLSEVLNVPKGRSYHKACDAILGDARCAFDMTQAGYFVDLAVEEVEGNRVFGFGSLNGFDPGWFEAGILEIGGVRAVIKADRFVDGERRIELWERFPGGVSLGDPVRLLAGCDKRVETCQLKFHNFVNFQGFPHIPGDDWLMSYPVRADRNDGGSRS